MLVTETQDFVERNSMGGICIRIFSFCTWFIHESEQSNQMRKSPKWKLHVCLKVLWLDPFPDILLLGSCTGVSDTSSIRIYAVRCGASKCRPCTAPSSSAESLPTKLHKHTSEAGVAGLPIMDRHANTWCCGMIGVSSRYMSYLDLNKMIRFRDSEWLSPESFLGFFFYIYNFPDCSHREKDSCCDYKA